MGADSAGLETVSAMLEGVAGRVAAGETLSEADARLVVDAQDLIAVGMLGDEVRRRLHGNRTTFVRVFEVHVDALPAALPPGAVSGEVRIVGRPQSIDAAVAAVRAGRALAGSGPLTGFSMTDLADLASAAHSIEKLFAQLREAGLDAIAETPLDALADATVCVSKARAAGLKVLRLTVNELTEARRVAIAAAARHLQAAVGGFEAFAPLPRVTSVAQPTTGYDDVKQVALARMIAINIPSIQVDWPLYGPKLAQVALTIGADDVDGVAAIDAGGLGARRSPIEEIRGNIRAAALEPVERNGVFERMA